MSQVKSLEAMGYGISRTINGTNGFVTGVVSVVAVATTAATAGTAAAIAAATGAGIYALTHTHKIVKTGMRKAEVLRNTEMATAFMEQHRAGPEHGQFSQETFKSTKQAYFSLEPGTQVAMNLSSCTWYGKPNEDDFGDNRKLDQAVAGSDLINNSYLVEYIAAGTIADYLMQNPTPLRIQQQSDEEISAHPGRQYLDQMKQAIGDAQVDTLLATARSVRSFSERFEILNKGIHSLSNVA